MHEFGGFVLVGISIGLLFCLFLLWKKLKEKERILQTDKEIAAILMRNIHAYILLIDTDFIVIQTNYYKLTHKEVPSTPKRVGELLQCRNATDAGECGGHVDCAYCPVRQAINRSFSRQENFRDLDASMTLYTDDNRRTLNCELMVSGAYLEFKEKGHLLLTLYDVTQLKQIQHELVEAREQAEQADRLKSAFLANMSHEIRTPLNAIVGFSELLVTADEEEKVKYLDIITENNSLLLQLINDILDVSKIEAGTLDFNYSVVDINQLIADLYELFRRKSMDNKQVEITYRLGAEKCVLFTEKNRLTQVLTNLLNNALKFTEKGSIRLGYEWRGKEIYFYVQDSGMGISPEKQTKLFQRFSKLNQVKPGTGLGLFISKMIVQKLGGNIGVDSQPDRGSLFWVTIPVTACVENPSKETSLMM